MEQGKKVEKTWDSLACLIIVCAFIIFYNCMAREYVVKFMCEEWEIMLGRNAEAWIWRILFIMPRNLDSVM